jgi:hypothetical protein
MKESIFEWIGRDLGQIGAVEVVWGGFLVGEATAMVILSAADTGHVQNEQERCVWGRKARRREE